MTKNIDEKNEQKAARLAEALRANLRRRKIPKTDAKNIRVDKADQSDDAK